MLKKASTLLPVFFSLWIGDVIGQSQADTINKISVKVIVKEKPETLINTSNLPKKPSEGNTPHHTNHQHLPKALNKTDTIDSNFETSLKKQTKDSLIKIISQKKSPSLTNAKQQNARKNTHFLFSLLLIVTGTLLAVFYRSGIPLIMAILLLVAGYYILIYTLVFMP